MAQVKMTAPQKLELLACGAKTRALENADAIKEHLQVDGLYALQLSALVDACIPIMHCELKDDACTNIDGYFHLGHKDFAKAKTLTEKLVYIYAMKFDGNNNATPIRNRPYQGELLMLLISNQLFHSSRAVGMKFASHFVEITKNKLKCPEILIPFLALVATAVVYSTLLWKLLGSPGKFNFSGNQFITYTHLRQAAKSDNVPIEMGQPMWAHGSNCSMIDKWAKGVYNRDKWAREMGCDGDKWAEVMGCNGDKWAKGLVGSNEDGWASS
ncbi:hypothetical protein BDR05DRAFT_946977 [Suillus weaverae]|nr:hypothetical protein BDR05DRAFT_946977 [Suillus weaverae]